MSQSDQSSQNQPKLSFADELKDAMRRNLELETKLEASEARHKVKDTQLSDLRKKIGAESEPKPEVKVETPPPAPPAMPKIELPTHAMSVTDQFCPTCGDKNEKWKDETECKDCGHPLGAIETLKDVKNCPGCGATGPIAKKKAGAKVGKEADK